LLLYYKGQGLVNMG